MEVQHSIFDGDRKVHKIMYEKSSQNTPLDCKTELVSEGKVYAGLVKNVSKSSSGYFVTFSLYNPDGFVPKKLMGLVFQTATEESLFLDCEFMWFSRPSPGAKQLELCLQTNSEYILHLLDGNKNPTTP